MPTDNQTPPQDPLASYLNFLNDRIVALEAANAVTLATLGALASAMPNPQQMKVTFDWLEKQGLDGMVKQVQSQEAKANVIAAMASIRFLFDQAAKNAPRRTWLQRLLGQ